MLQVVCNHGTPTLHLFLSRAGLLKSLPAELVVIEEEVTTIDLEQLKAGMGVICASRRRMQDPSTMSLDNVEPQGEGACASYRDGLPANGCAYRR